MLLKLWNCNKIIFEWLASWFVVGKHLAFYFKNLSMVRSDCIIFSLCLLNKTWKWLVDIIESWSTYKVHLAEYQHTKYFMEQERKTKYENNPITLMNGWTTMIKSLRTSNVHCVIILEGVDFAYDCRTHHKS